MKLTELKSNRLSEETKGKWKIGNLNGVYKNFKSEDSPEAKAWMRDKSREGDKKIWDGSAWVVDQKLIDRENNKADREQAKREKERDERNPYAPRKVTKDELEKLYDRAIKAAGSSFPDGDPIDHLIPFLDARNWNTEHIDMAFKKFGHGHEKKGWHNFLAQMWDDFGADQIADAKMDLDRGRKPDDNSPFFNIKDGKVVPRANPWKDQ